MGESVTRPMDRVLDAWSSGDHAGALRWAVPLLEAQPDSALALLATAYLSAKEGDPKTFDLGLKVAAHHAIDLGNLPLAVAVGALTRELGLDPPEPMTPIAAAYARGSARIKPGAPPALPAPAPDVDPLPETLIAKPLLDRALGAVEKAIEKIEAERDPESPLPPAPLCSSLDRASLRAFVEIFETKLFPAQTTVVEEGAIGSEAFVVARGELDVTKRVAGGECDRPSRSPRRRDAGRRDGDALACAARRHGLDCIVVAAPRGRQASARRRRGEEPGARS